MKTATTAAGKTPASTTTDNNAATKPPKGWRDVIPIHPAATLFPRMSEAELVELAEDIKKRAAEAAKKAKDATAPAGLLLDVNHTSSFDNQAVTTFGGSLNGAGALAAFDSSPAAPPPTDTPGQSVNIFA